MAKIDDILESLEKGFQNPDTTFGTVMVDDKEMPKLGLRRKVSGQTVHRIRFLSVGTLGATEKATFYGHKLSDCLKAALEWRGLPTKSRRGPNGNS
jgi:hypothetical protein